MNNIELLEKQVLVSISREQRNVETDVAFPLVWENKKVRFVSEDSVCCQGELTCALSLLRQTKNLTFEAMLRHHTSHQLFGGSQPCHVFIVW